MTDTRTFDELTHWNPWDRAQGMEGWSDPGWALPSDNTRYISTDDPYWDNVLDKARNSYGDPNIHYNTDQNIGQERYLVFGDGTRLPTDGTIVYHDSANNRNWIQNSDGTVSPQNPDGTAGVAIHPSGYRPTPDGKYAPVDNHGTQIAPLAGGMPPSDHGFFTDPKTGVLTPRNANGDYYTFDPASGQRAYFNEDGKPISEQQFNHAGTAPPGTSPDAQGLPTDEQQSGRTADAVRKLHEELKGRYSKISEAEGKLSEVLLNARATTTEGQQKLNQIQAEIVEAINNPALSLDTPAGEQAFLKFLRSQVAAIGEVLQSGTLTDADQSKAIAALSALYAVDPGGTGGPGTETGDPNQQPTPGSPGDAPVPGGDPAAVPPVDLGLGPAEAMPDPSLSDLGLGSMGGPLGADPLSSLASTLPAAMSAFPLGGGLGGSPLDALGGLAGAAAPLAGLASQLGDPGRREDPAHSADSGEEKDNEKSADAEAKDKEAQPDTAGQQPGQPVPPGPPQPQPAGTPGDGAPQGAPGAPPQPATSVQLPDGSTANARSPELAQAVKAHLGGTPVEEAYRQAGIQLPPPGTPVTNPVDPSQLACGNIGMFKDHYVVALSSVKALVDGQVVALSSVASSPDFLGWVDPTALGTAAPSPPPVPPVAPVAQPSLQPLPAPAPLATTPTG